MKKLKDTIKKINNVLISLEIILKEEHKNLLNPNKNVDMQELIDKKTTLFQKFFILTKDRLFFEQEYNIFAPYKDNDALNNYWIKIVKKCFLLRKFNLKNKILINEKFYLNQRFLELFKSYKMAITYNIDGNIKF